ncbi:ATP-binding protein [Streptomyces sp. XD-27]|uniref:ATP-binding protein n=1 Tax=Streptomyces sp. XD-27 TaxID=3062779 RepID=UPI0026F47A56|nr:ATP-binding protein [Streptomyces sp. XD-27]WKX72698.1 ATP-binding protein [Streptomyces sp. XD-27]
MQVVLVAVVVAGCAVFTYLTDRSQAETAARRQATAAATAVADSPSVVRAIRTADPTAALQPYAEQVRKSTGVTFVTIMDPRGIRWTHPDPERIGEEFLGHTAPALRGETFTETYTGTLGPSVRVVTPVRDGGRITGLVSAGITVDEISARLRDQLLTLLGVALAALALGGAGTYVINRRLRHHTHGMNAGELSRMYDYHQATLHAVREGLLMLDGQRRVALVNDGARELLGLTDPVGRLISDLGLPAPLTGALLAAEPRVDELHLTAERVLVVNTSPVSSGGQRGTVVTLRDHTELQALSGELDSVRGFTEALRSQAHEAANRLHTVVSLIELGRVEEAVDFATAELELAQALTDQVVAAVAEPVLAALLLGKAAQANERGVELVLAPDSRIDDGLLPPGLPARDLVTVLGNLVDNAIDAAADHRDAVRRPLVTVTARAADGELLLRVADTGAGVDPAAAEAVFRRGWTTKTAATEGAHGTAGARGTTGVPGAARVPGTTGVPGAAGPAGRGLGLALVRQAVRRNGGTVEVGPAADGGAEFTVRLPLTSGTPRRSDAHPLAGAAGTTDTTPSTEHDGTRHHAEPPPAPADQPRTPAPRPAPKGAPRTADAPEWRR